ncbi:hypothetical protein MKX01_014015 [Papaver californicum]|nr:hypothetical protein MKX01_014015 [Papaver californicum]
MKSKGRYQKESRKLYRKNQKKKQKIRIRLEKEEENLKSSIAVPIANEELEIGDPSSSETFYNTSAISQEDLEEQMNRIKEDPYLKPIRYTCIKISPTKYSKRREKKLFFSNGKRNKKDKWVLEGL